MRNKIVKENSLIFFPGLNMLRFIAALLVVIYHIESFKEKASYDNLLDINFFKNIGTQAVCMFFVLSGFLITYLLLIENERFGTVALKNFYIRRVLRIWPLYFFILLLGFVVIPLFYQPSFFKPFLETKFFEFFLSFFFMSNISLIVYGSHFVTGVLWSIGTEEQFYLLWPLLFLKKIKTQKFIKQVVLFLLGILIIKISSNFLLLIEVPSIFHKMAKFFIHFLYFDCMLVGAIFAYLLKEEKLLFDKTTRKSVVFFAVLLFVILINNEISYFGFRNLTFSTIYAIVISYLSTQVKSNKYINIIENKFWKWGGNISYGIYMYHSIFVGVAIYFYPKTNNLAAYAITIIGTLIVSTLSYYNFEAPFLKHKKRFAKVHSTN